MAKKSRLVVRAGINLDQLGFAKALARGECEGDLPARHKWNRLNESPYCVANEFICGKLADHIGLPIPPFAITQSDLVPGKNIFSTLNFNFDGRQLRPVLPEFLVSHLPELCAGVVAFDILVMNADRHDENLAVDNLSQPTAMQVFDHDVALFGWTAGEGIKRLEKLNGRLGITQGAVSQGNRHILLDAITTTKHFRPWTDRIFSIPISYIQTLCRQAIAYGITAAEADAAEKALTVRKSEIAGLITRHRAQFKGITRWETI
jgi:hypothetical protein